MVKVYLLEPNTDQCQWLVPTDPALIAGGALIFDGRPRKHEWTEPTFYVQNPLKKRSNFFLGVWGGLIFDGAVMNDYVARTHLELAGEILPARLESGEQLYVLNVTEVANALDHETTMFRKDRLGQSIMGVLRYAFKTERMIQSSIFKIPEMMRTDVLTVSGRFPEPEDEFYAAYQPSGLRGLTMREVWCSESRLGKNGK